MRTQILAVALCAPLATGLRVCGLDVPNARPSVAASVLDTYVWPSEFPYSRAELTPEQAGSDGSFYLLPKFVHHAGEECRASLRDFYSVALPTQGTGAVLDLCSSWTSHYPEGWCAALPLGSLGAPHLLVDRACLQRAQTQIVGEDRAHLSATLNKFPDHNCW